MHEMFIDNMFNDYQVKVIAVMNNYILSLMKQDRFQEAKGAMDLSRKVLSMPYTISKDDDVLNKMVENMKRFEAGFIKDAVK